jgi:hypothetical protein
MTNDEKLEAAFNHFQDQINHLAAFTGQVLAKLVQDNPQQCALLDHVISHWDGLAADNISKQRVMNHVRRSADRVLSANPDRRSEEEHPLW